MFTGPTRKIVPRPRPEAPKRRLKTTEDIESDYEPNENNGYNEHKYWIEGEDCFTVTTVHVYSVMDLVESETFLKSSLCFIVKTTYLYLKTPIVNVPS